MHPQRIDALAKYLESLVEEQKAEGSRLFTIGSEDRINWQDADEIVAALRAHALSSRADEKS